jgi:hypothetical protein
MWPVGLDVETLISHALLVLFDEITAIFLAFFHNTEKRNIEGHENEFHKFFKVLTRHREFSLFQDMHNMPCSFSSVQFLLFCRLPLEQV